MNATAKATVYFNSACPVCRTGIEWQQGRASSCEIEWIEVHQAPDRMLYRWNRSKRRW